MEDSIAWDVVSISLGLKTEPPIMLVFDKVELANNQIMVTLNKKENAQKILSFGYLSSKLKIIIVC